MNNNNNHSNDNIDPVIGGNLVDPETILNILIN